MRERIDPTSNWPQLLLERWLPLAALIAAIGCFSLVIDKLTGNAKSVTGFMYPLALLTIVAIVAPIMMSRTRVTLPQLVREYQVIEWRCAGPEWARYVAAKNRRRYYFTPYVLAFNATAIALVLIAQWIDADFQKARWLATITSESSRELWRNASIAMKGSLFVSIAFDIAFWLLGPKVMRGGGRAYIGQKAVYFCDSMNDFANCVRAEWVDGDPPCLRFDFAFGRGRQPIHIPVLRGHEDEARAVLARVQQICRAKSN